ncbi:hypothetical protein DSO57_1009170 [Entomophthora muscae]|uniref:Uncharacterized protein n=1 Tax=Entomophthora muscae TaxID=34485 RepID=A0ACC2T6X3_9FUNG|nr:hypothetical protein DSO57_1009170 [Entomophthora muscae]
MCYPTNFILELFLPSSYLTNPFQTNSILHDINTTQFPALTASLRNIEVQSELVSTLFKASSQASESSDFQQIPLFNLDDQGAVQNQHMS